MTKGTLEFVKELIEQQRKFVKSSSEDSAGEIAKGLFNNEEFCSVILSIFGAGYFRETKIELPSDSKNRALDTLDQMITAIEKELAKLT